ASSKAVHVHRDLDGKTVGPCRRPDRQGRVVKDNEICAWSASEERDRLPRHEAAPRDRDDRSSGSWPRAWGHGRHHHSWRRLRTPTASTPTTATEVEACGEHYGRDRDEASQANANHSCTPFRRVEA